MDWEDKNGPLGPLSRLIPLGLTNGLLTFVLTVLGALLSGTYDVLEDSDQRCH